MNVKAFGIDLAKSVFRICIWLCDGLLITNAVFIDSACLRGR